MQYTVHLLYNALVDKDETIHYDLEEEKDAYIMKVDCKGVLVEKRLPKFDIPEEFKKSAYDIEANRVYYENVKKKELDELSRKYFGTKSQERG